MNFRRQFALAFGTIIGVGWITVIGAWLSSAGPGGAVLAFAVGAALMLPVALCYFRIAEHLVDGGEMGFARLAAGRRGQFLCGWFLALTFIAVCAFEAVSAGWLMSLLLPEWGDANIYSFAGSGVNAMMVLVALAGTSAIAWANYRGVDVAASVQNWLTFSLIVLVSALVVLGFAGGSIANLSPFFGPANDGGWTGFLGVLVTTPFWFAGFNVAAQAVARGEPAAGRSVSKAMISAIVAGGCFYVLVILAVAAVASDRQWGSSELAAVSAFESAFRSPVLGKMILIGGLLGLVTTWNATFFASVQILRALSRNGLVPSWIGADPKTLGTRLMPIVLVGIVSLALAAIGRAALLPVVNVAGVVFAGVYLMVAVGLLRLHGSELGRRGRAIAGAATLFSFCMLLLGLWNISGPAIFWSIEWVLLLGWALLGLSIRYFVSRNRHELPRGSTSGL